MSAVYACRLHEQVNTRSLPSKYNFCYNRQISHTHTHFRQPSQFALHGEARLCHELSSGALPGGGAEHQPPRHESKERNDQVGCGCEECKQKVQERRTSTCMYLDNNPWVNDIILGCDFNKYAYTYGDYRSSRIAHRKADRTSSYGKVVPKAPEIYAAPPVMPSAKMDWGPRVRPEDMVVQLDPHEQAMARMGFKNGTPLSYNAQRARFKIMDVMIHGGMTPGSGAYHEGKYYETTARRADKEYWREFYAKNASLDLDFNDHWREQMRRTGSTDTERQALAESQARVTERVMQIDNVEDFADAQATIELNPDNIYFIGRETSGENTPLGTRIPTEDFRKNARHLQKLSSMGILVRKKGGKMHVLFKYPGRFVVQTQGPETVQLKTVFGDEVTTKIMNEKTTIVDIGREGAKERTPEYLEREARARAIVRGGGVDLEAGKVDLTPRETIRELSRRPIVGLEMDDPTAAGGKRRIFVHAGRDFRETSREAERFGIVVTQLDAGNFSRWKIDFMRPGTFRIISQREDGGEWLPEREVEVERRDGEREFVPPGAEGPVGGSLELPPERVWKTYTLSTPSERMVIPLNGRDPLKMITVNVNQDLDAQSLRLAREYGIGIKRRFAHHGGGGAEHITLQFSQAAKFPVFWRYDINDRAGTNTAAQVAAHPLRDPSLQHSALVEVTEADRPKPAPRPIEPKKLPVDRGEPGGEVEPEEMPLPAPRPAPEPEEMKPEEVKKAELLQKAKELKRDAKGHPYADIIADMVEGLGNAKLLIDMEMELQKIEDAQKTLRRLAEQKAEWERSLVTLEKGWFEEANLAYGKVEDLNDAKNAIENMQKFCESIEEFMKTQPKNETGEQYKIIVAVKLAEDNKAGAGKRIIWLNVEMGEEKMREALGEFTKEKIEDAEFVVLNGVDQEARQEDKEVVEGEPLEKLVEGTPWEGRLTSGRDYSYLTLDFSKENEKLAGRKFKEVMQDEHPVMLVMFKKGKRAPILIMQHADGEPAPKATYDTILNPLRESGDIVRMIENKEDLQKLYDNLVGRLAEMEEDEEKKPTPEPGPLPETEPQPRPQPVVPENMEELTDADLVKLREDIRSQRMELANVINRYKPGLNFYDIDQKALILDAASGEELQNEVKRLDAIEGLMQEINSANVRLGTNFGRVSVRGHIRSKITDINAAMTSLEERQALLATNLSTKLTAVQREVLRDEPSELVIHLDKHASSYAHRRGTFTLELGVKPKTAVEQLVQELQHYKTLPEHGPLAMENNDILKEVHTGVQFEKTAEGTFRIRWDKNLYDGMEIHSEAFETNQFEPKEPGVNGQGWKFDAIDMPNNTYVLRKDGEASNYINIEDYKEAVVISMTNADYSNPQTIYIRKRNS